MTTDQEVGVRDGTRAPFKMLPDAVMDDDGLSNEAKLTYWYFKRIATFGDNGKARVSIGKLATKMNFSANSKRCARGWIDELVERGWVEVTYHSRTGTDGKVEHLASEYAVNEIPAATRKTADQGVGAGEHLGAASPLGTTETPGGVGAGENGGRGSTDGRVGAGEPPCSRRFSTKKVSSKEKSTSSSRASRSTTTSPPPDLDLYGDPVGDGSEADSSSHDQDQGRHGGDQLPPVNAGDVVKVWIDAYVVSGAYPPESRIKQVGRMAKELLAKNDPQRVLAAAREAGFRGHWAIDREMTSNGHSGYHDSRPPKPSATERTFARIDAAADRLRQSSRNSFGALQ